MKFLFRGHRKNLRERTESIRRDYDEAIFFRGDTFRVGLVNRRGKEQYAFVGKVADCEEGCLIEGDIELVGTPWRWYDYVLSVLLCLLVIPALASSITVQHSLATGQGLLCPFPAAGGKRDRERRLANVMALFTVRTE